MDNLTLLKPMGHAQMYPKAKEIAESLPLRSHRELVEGKLCAFLSI